jgi:hypothetical protein
MEVNQRQLVSIQKPFFQNEATANLLLPGFTGKVGLKAISQFFAEFAIIDFRSFRRTAIAGMILRFVEGMDLFKAPNL